MLNEPYVAALREFVDFVNQQVGVFCDAASGFAGNKVRIERQVARISAPVSSSRNSDGRWTVMRASLEDPSRPDVIHHRILRTDEFIAANSELGFNQQQCIRGVLVFTYTFWEDEIRPRLATALGDPKKDIKVHALGDLRILRNCIIHQHGVLSAEEHSKLLRFSTVFAPGKGVLVTYDQMHDIFVGVKQAIAELIIAQTGPLPGQPDPTTIVDIAIPR